VRSARVRPLSACLSWHGCRWFCLTALTATVDERQRRRGRRFPKPHQWHTNSYGRRSPLSVPLLPPPSPCPLCTGVQSAGRPVIRLLRRLALSFAFCFAFAFAALAKEPRRLPNSDRADAAAAAAAAAATFVHAEAEAANTQENNRRDVCKWRKRNSGPLTSASDPCSPGLQAPSAFSDLPSSPLPRP
jgi:hypothetical protein